MGVPGSKKMLYLYHDGYEDLDLTGGLFAPIWIDSEGNILILFNWGKDDELVPEDETVQWFLEREDYDGPGDWARLQ